jgi:hypothetical protein
MSLPRLHAEVSGERPGRRRLPVPLARILNARGLSTGRSGARGVVRRRAIDKPASMFPTKATGLTPHAGPRVGKKHRGDGAFAHGERLYGHVDGGCTKRVHVKPARSIFSNALNFCRSAIAALVRSPWRYWPFRSPGGPPLPFAPPCNRQRPFFVAGDRQGFPLLVRAPH